MNAHIFSELRSLKGNYISFSTASGRTENAYVVDGVAHHLGFDGDYTFSWGMLQITLGGDLFAAYEWLRERYNPSLPSFAMGSPE